MNFSMSLFLNHTCLPRWASQNGSSPSVAKRVKSARENRRVLSTSNHNSEKTRWKIGTVVSYWISTSNHNSSPERDQSRVLYLIEFLHQTTTLMILLVASMRLYLIEFLHQTTTLRFCVPLCPLLYLIEFLHQTTTRACHGHRQSWLYLIEFLHQTTTNVRLGLSKRRCILLNFYIKPQLCVP